MSRWKLQDVPELRPVLAALERGTRRARLRVLTVVCARNHTLFEVYRGSDSQLYCLALRTGVQGMNPHELVDRLDQPATLDEAGRSVVGAASCRCHHAVWLHADRLQDVIASGRTRVALRRVAPG